MNQNKGLATLFDRLMAILAKQPKEYPGIRFDAGEPEWRGGYGVPIDNETPDFVKKDNDGWDTIKQSERE